MLYQTLAFDEFLCSGPVGLQGKYTSFLIRLMLESSQLLGYAECVKSYHFLPPMLLLEAQWH